MSESAMRIFFLVFVSITICVEIGLSEQNIKNLNIKKVKYVNRKSFNKYPQIRHRLLVNTNSSNSISNLKRRDRQKVVNLPNHWDKNPFLFQTYK